MEKKAKEVKFSSERVRPMKEKVEYVTLPSGFVRCICLESYLGMTDSIYKDDVIDLPERRFKTLSARGWVALYTGDKKPINKR